MATTRAQGGEETPGIEAEHTNCDDGGEVEAAQAAVPTAELRVEPTAERTTEPTAEHTTEQTAEQTAELVAEHTAELT